MESKTCKDCDNYLPHYVYSLDRLVRTGCGHCRSKPNRSNFSKPCSAFKEINKTKFTKIETAYGLIKSVSNDIKNLLSYLEND